MRAGFQAFSKELRAAIADNLISGIKRLREEELAEAIAALDDARSPFNLPFTDTAQLS